MMTNCSAVILAAGDGARMKTTIPYVMLKVLSKPMVSWVLSAVQKSGIQKIAMVVADRKNPVAQFAKTDCAIYEQTIRSGTAHAILQAEEFVKKNINDHILVLNGDMPFMDAGTIRNALLTHMQAGNDVTVISARLENPFGYGRILRNYSDGTFKGIVEERDASSQIKRIKEISAGTYWFKASVLLSAVQNLKPRPNGEYNLVDAITNIIKQGGKADTVVAANPDVVLGANDRSQLYELNRLARHREIERHIESGINIRCADGILIDPEVSIGIDTTILPGTILRGNVKIGHRCILGPNTIIEDSVIGDNVHLNNVSCCSATVKDGAFVGPFVHIRPGTQIGENAFIENNVSFLTPVVIGDDVHIPAGTVVKKDILQNNLKFSDETENREK